MEHIVNTAMVYITGTDFDRSVHRAFVNKCHHFIKTSLDRCGVMAKLKQIGRLPIHKIIFAGKKTAD